MHFGANTLNKPDSLLRTKIITHLDTVKAHQWNALAGDDPFLRYEFLKALQDTGCVGQATGWEPQFITLWDAEKLCAAMPLYRKSHSYGEYVFDWSWADAYQRHGVNYYPKLINAVPFTPVTGKRLLGAPETCRKQLLDEALRLAIQTRASSLHCLFPDHLQAQEMEASGMMMRTGLQFHWHNRGYESFDAFLAQMSHDKRKRIKQERRKLREAGIQFVFYRGHEITDSRWEFFYHCYSNTYRRHYSTPYLKPDFFRQIGATMPENILLVAALRSGKPVACALNLFNTQCLYGRYWGALERFPGLHFETCYYQAIEFCIVQRLEAFEAGAQGEHKLARGLLPQQTWSAHWLAHPGFAQAVEMFLGKEKQGVVQYVDELNERAPFRNA